MKCAKYGIRELPLLLSLLTVYLMKVRACPAHLPAFPRRSWSPVLAVVPSYWSEAKENDYINTMFEFTIKPSTVTLEVSQPSIIKTWYGPYSSEFAEILLHFELSFTFEVSYPDVALE